MNDAVGPRSGDPLLTSRFVLSLDGAPVAGVLRVSALEVAGPGGAPAPVIVVRVAGTDDVLGDWARNALGGGQAPERDVVLTLLDAAGAPALAWRLVRAAPVRYSPVGELDALTEQVATETLTLTVTAVHPA